jgi:hypothetical protein
MYVLNPAKLQAVLHAVVEGYSIRAFSAVQSGPISSRTCINPQKTLLPRFNKSKPKR